jgi:hypothetical protein
MGNMAANFVKSRWIPLFCHLEEIQEEPPTMCVCNTTIVVLILNYGRTKRSFLAWKLLKWILWAWSEIILEDLRRSFIMGILPITYLTDFPFGYQSRYGVHLAFMSMPLALNTIIQLHTVSVKESFSVCLVYLCVSWLHMVM